MTNQIWARDKETKGNRVLMIRAINDLDMIKGNTKATITTKINTRSNTSSPSMIDNNSTAINSINKTTLRRPNLTTT
jgi:hypothetical protein